MNEPTANELSRQIATALNRRGFSHLDFDIAIAIDNFELANQSSATFRVRAGGMETVRTVEDSEIIRSVAGRMVIKPEIFFIAESIADEVTPKKPKKGSAMRYSPAQMFGPARIGFIAILALMLVSCTVENTNPYQGSPKPKRFESHTEGIPGIGPVSVVTDRETGKRFIMTYNFILAYPE